MKFVAKIRSDLDEAGETLYYSLRGPGANQEPVNLFVVEETTGLVHITGILDRELFETYTLTGEAKFPNGTIAEYRMDLQIAVEDENDNAPVFPTLAPASVNESSPPGNTLTYRSLSPHYHIPSPNHRLCRNERRK
ncbi:unnamed protein product [Coregonus sp. 'balchen']|nr:unnamed protein product [Coregonus sp. 'balchen']